MGEMTTEQWERVFDIGRARAERDEVDRLIAIYSHRLAREKPVSAWSVLPLGRSVEASLGMIAMMIEAQPPDPSFYQDNLEMLEQRRNVMLAAQELRTNHDHARH